MLLNIIMALLTLLPVVIGLLFGFMRGMNRSIWRILLVILCAVGAFFLRGLVGEKVAAIEIDGVTIASKIANAFGDVQGMEDIVMPIVYIVINVVVFFILFMLLRLLTWAIIYPLGKIFIKKGAKKRGFFGGIIGLVQGAAVAFILCITVNGLLVNVAEVYEMTSSLQESGGKTASVMEYEYPSSETSLSYFADGSSKGGIAGQLPELLTDYKDNSFFVKLYNGIGSWAFDKISSVKIQGEPYTLTGQIKAFSAMTNMAKELNKIADIKITPDMDVTESANAVKDVFYRLGEINGELSSESKATVNRTLQTVANNFDLPIDVSKIDDFTGIDFKKEGDIVAGMAEYSKKETVTEQDAKAIVELAAQSDLILPVLESVPDFDLQLNEAQKAEVEKAIDGLSNVSQEKIDSMKNLFGITAVPQNR